MFGYLSPAISQGEDSEGAFPTYNLYQSWQTSNFIQFSSEQTTVKKNNEITLLFFLLFIIERVSYPIAKEP
jgi:hypothetical protein